MAAEEMNEDSLEEGEGVEGKMEKPKMDLGVQVDVPSACERHVTVTIPRADVDRYFDDVYSELMPSAAVPGFRPGRAPRKLVEQRFRKDVIGQVKGSLVMDSIAQASEDQKLTAISEPDFNFAAVEVPEEGDMTFEFDIEVRPEFELPQWKGLTVERPTQEITDENVQQQVKSILGRYASLRPSEGNAEPGDYLSVNIHVRQGEKHLSTEKEKLVCIKPKLTFHDAEITDFDKLMVGAGEGDKRQTEVELSADSPNEALAGQKVEVEFEVLDVKKLELPELNESFLDEMGGFKTVEELHDAIRANFARQLEYQQQRRAREQVSAALIESANWDLPPRLLKRQSSREMERAILELRRNGFSEEEIRAQENELRRSNATSTAKALKEHFILERIAEEEAIEAVEADYEEEIRLIARQSRESVRRVRAQLEKNDLMDTLRNQIVERKVIDRVLAEAKFHDVPLQVPGETDTFPLDLALGGVGELEKLDAAGMAAAAAAGTTGEKPAANVTQSRPQ
jgi:trigger factor